MLPLYLQICIIEREVIVQVVIVILHVLLVLILISLMGVGTVNYAILLAPIVLLKVYAKLVQILFSKKMEGRYVNRVQIRKI